VSRSSDRGLNSEYKLVARRHLRPLGSEGLPGAGQFDGAAPASGNRAVPEKQFCSDRPATDYRSPRSGRPLVEADGQPPAELSTLGGGAAQCPVWIRHPLREVYQRRGKDLTALVIKQPLPGAYQVSDAY
jgi:hypothetical protein